MELDKFIERVFENLVDSKQSLDCIKATIKSNMITTDYDTTKVECQIYTDENNYNPRVEISSENYNDGEVLFIDFHLEE